MGITITAACHTIFFSYGHGLGNEYLQPLGRNYRPGQDRPVTVHHLKCVGTVDELIHANLESKNEMETMITDWKGML